MDLDISQIEFSRNDLKQKIKLPKKLCPHLAYLLGFHMGDGTMNIYKTANKTEYRVAYDGHYIEEFEWYKQHLIPLIKKLFNKSAILRITTSKTVNVIVYSKAITLFLSKTCGLPLGRKKNYRFPEIIQKGSSETKKNYLRGLADADFSLTFKKRHKDENYYPVIDCQTADEVLYNATKEILIELGFRFYCNSRICKRGEKRHKNYYLQLNGTTELKKWMDNIGFDSPVQKTKYLLWKKQGFVPPYTSLKERLSALK